MRIGLKFLIIFLTPLCGCVSVKIAGSKLEKAKGYEYQAPAGRFEKLDSNSADIAWISKSTGNTIAILTDCGPQADLALTAVEGETLSALNNVNILNRQEKSYNGRTAFFTDCEGLMDGVPVHLSLVSFQKNGCNFSLSHFGHNSAKTKERPIFQSFVEGFKAP